MAIIRIRLRPNAHDSFYELVAPELRNSSTGESILRRIEEHAWANRKGHVFDFRLNGEEAGMLLRLFKEKAHGGEDFRKIRRRAFLRIASEIEEYIELIQQPYVGPNALIQDGRIVKDQYNFER